MRCIKGVRTTDHVIEKEVNIYRYNIHSYFSEGNKGCKSAADRVTKELTMVGPAE